MAMPHPARTAASFRPGSGPVSTPITVLRVSDEDGTDRVGARLEREDGIRVETVAAPADVARFLGSVDCVVSEATYPDDALVDLLSVVRARGSDLPVVLLARDPSPRVVDALDDTPWTDCLQWDANDEQANALVRRVTHLVGYRRVTALARRALAAVEQGTDAVAVVAPDGTVEFVNSLFARTLDATAEDLVGRSWRALYPDAEVTRLETHAFPSLADGWRWVGDCELCRDDGSTVVAQLRIDALDDDGMVFTLSDRSDEN